MMKIINEIHFTRELKVFEHRPENLFSMLEASAREYPEHEAIVRNEVRLTYKEMVDKVRENCGEFTKLLVCSKGRPNRSFIRK